MSAGPLETYNGTSGVANNGGDSLTEDREFLFLTLYSHLHTVLFDLTLEDNIIYYIQSMLFRKMATSF